jgi:hypothetical protein
MIGDQLCLFPTKDSAKVIPREAYDSRMAWFCFSNREDAMKLLKIPHSKPKGGCGYALEATVVVTDYVVNLLESEVFDTARLVKVVSSRPQNLLCRR